MGERFHPRRKKTPSFSSSLLDAILVSIDEPPHDGNGTTKKLKSQWKHDKFDIEEYDSVNNKWMQNYIKGTTTTTRRSHSNHFNSDSSSSAESTLFSSIETEPPARVSNTKHEEGGRLFMTTRLKALKIYKDLKKVRQPISPGGKFTSFLNSFLFNTKHLSISGIKSRQIKDSNIKSQTLRPPCLDKEQAPSSSSAATNKSKRSVTFCPAVSVIIDEGHQKKKNIYDMKQSSRINNAECVPKSIERFRDYGVKHSYEYGHLFRGYTEQECSNDDDDDDDGESCTSSDLFELDDIGFVGMVSSDEELPVYGTTKLSRTQGFATMVVV